jgi:hypothetical protein
LIGSAFGCKSVASNKLDGAIDKLPTVSSCLDEDGECEDGECKDGVMLVVSRGSSV